jgi:3-oxoacyl-[acyl-carrier-protein] synthase II
MGASDSIVISGFGIVSPLGDSPAVLAERVCRGETALDPLSDMGIAGVTGAVVPDITLDALPAEAHSRVGRLDRLCRLFLAATYRAVADAQLDLSAIDGERIGLSFGTGFGCLLTNAEYYEKVVEHGTAAASPRLFAYTVSNAAAGEVSIALGIRGPNLTVHAGLAAGLQAIGYGVDLLRSGKADVVIAGGADALGAALLRALADMHLLKPAARAVPFRDLVPGVYPSEGAAVVVLERAAAAAQRGVRASVRIDGWAAGFEPTLTCQRREPAGLVATLQRAAAGRADATVDFVITSAQNVVRLAIPDTPRPEPFAPCSDRPLAQNCSPHLGFPRLTPEGEDRIKDVLPRTESLSS